MGQHAQAIREKHTARNVTLIVLAVLIVLLAIAAVFGMQLYKQAKKRQGTRIASHILTIRNQ